MYFQPILRRITPSLLLFCRSLRGRDHTIVLPQIMGLQWWLVSMVTKERNLSFNQARACYGAAGVTYPPPQKPLLTLWAPTPPSTSTSNFVFFFPDWVEQVPMCSSLNDLEDVMEPLMKFISIHISCDPVKY